MEAFGVFLYKKIKKHAETSGNHVAIVNVETHEEVTFKGVFDKSNKITKMLLDFKGTHTLDSVAVCAENNLSYLLPVIGCFYLGCPLVNISHTYTKLELLYALNITKPNIIFSSQANYKLLDSVCTDNNLDFVKKIIVFESIQYDSDESNNESEFIVESGKNDTATMMFSSGTTGMPKAVMISHENIAYFYQLFLNDNFCFSHVLNNIIIVPFSHAYGFILSLVTLTTGHTIKFMPRFDEDIFLQSLVKYQVPALTLVPSLMVWLAKSPKLDDYDLSFIKRAVCGGGTLSEKVITGIQQRFPQINVYQVYGMTETTLAATSTPLEINPLKLGSVGKAVPEVVIKIRQLTPTKPDPTNHNEIGEILIKGPNVTKGYFQNSLETENTYLSDGFVATGDLGYIDDEGYLYVVDRVKDLIKYNAYQVPPSELEELLMTHEAVADAAVVGLKHEIYGELPFAFVVKKTGSIITQEEIQEFIKQQVSYPKYLRGGVRFVDIIPRTAIGKIKRYKLRNQINSERI